MVCAFEATDAPKLGRFVSTKVSPGEICFTGFWPYLTERVSLPPRNSWSTRRVQRSAFRLFADAPASVPVGELGEPSDLNIAAVVGSVMPAASAVVSTFATVLLPAPRVLSTSQVPKKNVWFL